MNEIDEIWAIYRRNLGQNSCWNINLPLKINFGCWIKNWKQSGRWIAILPLESHLGCQINTGMIWAVRSRCMKKRKYRQKIDDLSLINRRYIVDILPPEAIFSQNRQFISPSWYITDILANIVEKNWRGDISENIAKISTIYLLGKIYRRFFEKIAFGGKILAIYRK